MSWTIILSVIMVLLCYSIILILVRRGIFGDSRGKRQRRTTSSTAVSRLVHERIPSDQRGYTLQRKDKPLANLKVVEGHQKGHVFVIYHPDTRIGRNLVSNEIVLDDPYVTIQHARITFEDGKYLLIDLASTNGTYVNGKRITREYIQGGDEIEMGQTRMIFHPAD